MNENENVCVCVCVCCVCVCCVCVLCVRACVRMCCAFSLKKANNNENINSSVVAFGSKNTRAACDI